MKTAFGKSIMTLAIGITASYTLWQPASGEISSAVQLNDYIKREFDWSVSIDLKDMPHYFKYKESSLRPLTKASLNLKTSMRSCDTVTTQLYEDIWYYKETPIGSRRYTQANGIAPSELGVIVLKHIGPGAAHPYMALNAAIRVMLDFQLKHLNIGTILVPAASYYEIADELGRFHFVPMQHQLTSGQQLSIRLRSYPRDKEQVFYYQK